MKGRLIFGLVVCAGVSTLLLVLGTSLGQDVRHIRLNRTIELLEQGKPTFGIFSKDRSLDNARELARSSLDFIIIDMEHGPFDVETLRSFLLGMIDKRAILESGSLQPKVTPMVRIATNGIEQLQFLAKQVLDVGVFGVMFPYVGNRDEAFNAIRSVRYPQRKGVPDIEPAGIRGNAPGNAVWYWGVSDYTDRADLWPLDPQGDILAVTQIETPEGVKNVDDILSVPGIGAIFIGPSDLSMSLGHPNDLSAPEVEAAIQEVLKACRGHNIPCGITTGPADVEKRIREGFRFVTVGLDGGITPSSATALQRGRTVAGR
jgi:4-hydroxy-2-oxoheptanedioate aldolase